MVNRTRNKVSTYTVNLFMQYNIISIPVNIKALQWPALNLCKVTIAHELSSWYCYSRIVAPTFLPFVCRLCSIPPAVQWLMIGKAFYYTTEQHTIIAASKA